MVDIGDGDDIQSCGGYDDSGQFKKNYEGVQIGCKYDKMVVGMIVMMTMVMIRLIVMVMKYDDCNDYEL